MVVVGDVMNVHCAWCEKEGIINVINKIEGPDDQVSHGICGRHQDEMLAQIEELKIGRPTANPRRRRRRR